VIGSFSFDAGTSAVSALRAKRVSPVVRSTAIAPVWARSMPGALRATPSFAGSCEGESAAAAGAAAARTASGRRKRMSLFAVRGR